jgi:predicted transcriptional regulator
MGRAEDEVLRILSEGGDAYQADIVRATGFSKASVSEAIAELERKRMVRRTSIGRSSKLSLVGKSQKANMTLRLGFTRAAEYPFLVPFKKALKEDGIGLEFRVYENGLSVARDLSTFDIDLGVAPILALFMLHSLDAPLKIIGPAGSGGSSVLASPKGAHHAEPTAFCTKMSTMELLMRSAMRHHSVPEVRSLSYAASPREIGDALMSGAADVCSIWEPYATILEGKGAKRLLRYSELSDHVCCAFAAGNHLGEALHRKLSRRYAASLEEFNRRRDAFVAPYSALAGLDSSVVARVSGEYSYPLALSPDDVVSQLEEAGMTVPSPSSFRDAVIPE